MPFEKGAGTGGDFVRSIGGASPMAVPSFAAFRIHRCRWRAVDSVVGGLHGIRLRRRFSRRRSSGGRACARFPVGRIRDSFAGTRPSAIEPFYRATEDVSSETFFRSGWPTANMPRCGDEAGSLGRRCTLRRRAGAPSRVVCRICDGVRRNRATGFSFRGDMGPSACPSPRPIRTAAGRNDGRTGPEREDWLLATRQRRAEAAMRWPRSLRRPFGVLRPSCGDRPDSCPPALFFRSGAAVPQKVLPQICRGDGASKGTGRNGRRGSEFLERNNKNPVFYVIFAQRGFLSRTSACRGRACSGT